MKCFTKKWEDYINKNWREFIGIEEINIADPNELYDGKYNDSLLEEEFEKYYNAKDKYVSMYNYFEEEFDDYERIELLSKKEEYSKYIKRFEKLVCRLKEGLEKRIIYKDNSSDYNIDNIDFKLLVLGKVNIETRDTVRKCMYSEMMLSMYGDEYFINRPIMYKMSLNMFLNNYDSFYSVNNIKIMNEELEFFDFHDARISFYEHKDNNIILDIDSDWDYNTSIKIEFISANISYDLGGDMKISHDNIDIFDVVIKYYSDIGYYFYFEIIIHNYDTGVIEEKEVIITSKDIKAIRHDTNKLNSNN